MKVCLIRTALAFVLGLFATASSHAAELTPRIHQQSIGVSLTGLVYPDTLARDFMSGFENRVVIRFAVLSGDTVIERSHATVVVKYDLWEEQFTVRTVIADAMADEITFKQAPEVLQYLSRFQFDGLFRMESLGSTQELSLQAELSVNPIEREKIERVRQWVATNSVPRGAASAGPAGSALTAQPNDLFNRIFDQYIRGEDVVATWKLTVSSKAFKPVQLDPIAK